MGNALARQPHRAVHPQRREAVYRAVRRGMKVRVHFAFRPSSPDSITVMTGRAVAESRGVKHVPLPHHGAACTKGENMKRLFASVLLAGTLAGLGAAEAAQGCGPGFHRGPYGGCRPNGG